MIEDVGLTMSLVKYLREKIIIGELAPSQNINENQIASSLSVSQSPLREALRVLETEQLVINIHNKGSYVTSISVEDFEESVQVREMIESYAIELMKKKNIRDLDEVALIVERDYQVFLPPSDAQTQEKLAFIAKSKEYHAKLVESADNNKLLQLYHTVSSVIERYQFIYAFNSGFPPEAGKADHKEVIELITKGQYENAKECLWSHIYFFANKMKKRMEDEK